MRKYDALGFAIIIYSLIAAMYSKQIVSDSMISTQALCAIINIAIYLVCKKSKKEVKSKGYKGIQLHWMYIGLFILFIKSYSKIFMLFSDINKYGIEVNTVPMAILCFIEGFFAALCFLS